MLKPTRVISRLRNASKTALLASISSTLLILSGAQAQMKMDNMPGMSNAKAAPATSATALGTVQSIDAAQRKIKLNHEPIPAFNWPAMSMEMSAAPSIDLAKIKPGSKVKFTVTKGSDGSYMVQSVASAE